MKARLRKVTPEGLDDWRDEMDEVLAEFFALLPASVRGALDYSIDSMDVLEAWLLDPQNEMVAYVGLDAEVIEDFILRVSEGDEITTFEMHKQIN